MSTNNGPQGPQQGQTPPWMQQPQSNQAPPWIQQHLSQGQMPPQSSTPQQTWQGQPPMMQGYPQGFQSPPQGYPQGYPPPQMQQQPPQAPQKKKSRTGCIIGVVALVVILALCGIAQAASKAGSQPSGNTINTIATKAPASTPVFSGSTPLPTYPPTATPKPTQAPTWHTIQSFTGNGTKKTATFEVPSDWKINYTCQGFTDGSGIDGLLAVNVFNSDGTLADQAVNATCKAGKTTADTTEEHQGGSVYLDMDGTGDWTIQVQVLQ